MNDRAADSVEEHYHPNGKLRIRVQIVDHLPHGRYEMWDECGNRVLESNYENGTLQGSFRTWWPNGQVREVGTYVDGQRTGNYEWFYDDGRLESSYRYDPAMKRRMRERGVAYLNSVLERLGPNHVPKKTRMWCLGIAIFLLIYGAFGVWMDDVYVPGKRGRGIHFHGESAKIACAAYIAIACERISIVIDHYDTRKNERVYRLFGNSMLVLSAAFFVGAVALGVKQLLLSAP